MTNVSPQILALQLAYAARPFAVRWVDSHCSTENRFDTFDAAFAYVQQMWAFIQKEVKTHRCRASTLRQCYLETPAGRISLYYYLLCEDVSSY